jgi:type I restriction enzyme R subunit
LIAWCRANVFARNRSRMDFYDTFEHLIADYNAGATNAEALFAQLVDFTKQLNEEERRGIREQLDDEQLATFDIPRGPAFGSPNKNVSK